jgi:hypothetical protein
MRLGKSSSGPGDSSSRLLLPPPSRVQQLQLSQILASGMLDQVAKRASGGEVVEASGVVRRDAYISCSGSVNAPLYLSSSCALYDRDWKSLPDYVCYESIVKKSRRGEDVMVMQNVVKVEPNWLNVLGKDSPMLVEGGIVASPEPVFDGAADALLCSVETKYGSGGWLLPPKTTSMREAMQRKGFKDGIGAQAGDNYAWFARRLLEGSVFEELGGLSGVLSDDAKILSQKKNTKKVVLLVAELDRKGCDSRARMVELLKADDKWLWPEVKAWCTKDGTGREKFKGVWMAFVKMAINL